MKVSFFAIMALGGATHGLASEAELRLPRAPEAAEHIHAQKPAVRIRIGRDQRVILDAKALQPSKVDKRWAGHQTLHTVSTVLAEARRNRRLHAELPVLLEFDKGTPWLYVEWVLCICHEREFRRTYLVVTGDRLSAIPFFGTPPKADATGKLVVSIDITRCDSEEKSVKYAFPWGEVPLAQCEKILEDIVDDRPKRDGAPIEMIGEARASALATVDDVLVIVDLFAKVGADHIHVNGRRCPTADVRRMAVLPKPRGNELPKSMTGTGGTTIDLE